MNALESLGTFVHDFRGDRLSAAHRERLKLHVLDTIGAMLAGSQTPEGAAIGALARRDGRGEGIPIPGFSWGTSLPAAIATACASARCTEMDDIHLASATTPGSVVVSAAFALASSGALETSDSFLAAVACGYEVMIRTGLAAKGPAMLQRREWPTLFAAPIGAAAVAARAYGLSPLAAAGAFATALALSTRTAIGARAPGTSRWLTLGVAAANGAVAAAAARENLVGDLDLIERSTRRGSSLSISRRYLLSGLGKRYDYEDVGLKPYPVARQGLAAVEACREILASNRIDRSGIEEIIVGVPEPQRMVIDQASWPATRFGSIVSAQYQCALAIVDPDRLVEPRRSAPADDDRVRTLLSRIRIERAPDLERHYPDAWPARVQMRVGGNVLTAEQVHPAGDARNPLSQDDVLQKFRRAAAGILPERHVNAVIEGILDAEDFARAFAAAGG